jgi:hypothetical protein
LDKDGGGGERPRLYHRQHGESVLGVVPPPAVVRGSTLIVRYACGV